MLIINRSFNDLFWNSFYCYYLNIQSFESNNNENNKDKQ